MSSQVRIEINKQDLAEIQTIIDKLGQKVAKKEITKAFRVGAKPLIVAAKMNAPSSGKKTWYSLHKNVKKGQFEYKARKHESGELKRSIGSVIGRSKDAVLYTGPRGGKKATSNFDAWYAHFVEYGTQGYTIKKDKKIPTPTGIVTLKAGTRIPGQQPQAFMRRAWDTTKQQSFMLIKSELRKLVTKIMTK